LFISVIMIFVYEFRSIVGCTRVLTHSKMGHMDPASNYWPQWRIVCAETLPARAHPIINYDIALVKLS
jgi:hypothetical protein